MFAPTLADLRNTPGGFHPLSADRAGQFALNLWRQYRLIFEPYGEPIPRKQDGGIDESKVTSIAIEGIVDYHGK